MKPISATQPIIVLLLLLATVVVAVRLVGLSQYPLVHPDEGFWADGSRDLVLYGDGLLDGRLHPFLSPGMFLQLAAWFLLVPPDLLSAREFSAIAGIATCVVLGFMARRRMPSRGWLVVFLFGLSGLAVLADRIMLLEALQTFWMALAAFFWLRPGAAKPFVSGTAFAVALLVKSNAIYLLPVFLLTLPEQVGRTRSRSAALFLAAMIVFAGGCYLSAWLAYPTQFTQAFQFELGGQRFVADGVLFHLGRFGLFPRAALDAVAEFFYTDAALVLFALVGLVLVRAGYQGDRADRFFALWLMFGAAFIFGQIYVQYRYLTTLAPALAWIGARAIERLLSFAPRSKPFLIGAVLLVGFGLATMVRVGAGVIRQGNVDYWKVVGWVRDHVPGDDRILAAPVIDLSLPQAGYDFYRQLIPYEGERRTLASVETQLGTKWIIVDPEWRQYQTAEDAQDLDRHCRPRATLGAYTVCEVMPESVP
jgi:hypothetical protein